MALYSEKVKDHFRNPRNKAAAEALDGLPAYKMHCSDLAEEAIQAALEDYRERSGKDI